VIHAEIVLEWLLYLEGTAELGEHGASHLSDPRQDGHLQRFHQAQGKKLKKAYQLVF